eukprot:3750990-Prorocentrum_lima.AAC.1
MCIRDRDSGEESPDQPPRIEEVVEPQPQVQPQHLQQPVVQQVPTHSMSSQQQAAVQQDLAQQA